MGSSQSQFETRFHQLYNFIQLKQDPHFNQIKIYRKTKFNFDYIMIIERTLSQIFPTITMHQIKALEENISLVRNYQNHVTAKIQYFSLQENYECTERALKMYVQYYNHTLFDYVNALRIKIKQINLQQIGYVVYTLAEAVIALKKMKIYDYEITLKNIFVSVENGKIMVSPAYFICQAFNFNSQKEQIKLVNNQYEKFSLSKFMKMINSHSINQKDYFQKKYLENICRIFLELTLYLHNSFLQLSTNLYKTLQKCKTLKEVIKKFTNNVQELNIAQFEQNSEEIGQLY